MDTGLGRLEPISDLKAQELGAGNVGGVFTVGEIVELKGSKFRVHRIDPKKLILRILPK